MADDPKISLETTMRALLLIALRNLETEKQVETLMRAGFGNTEIAKMTGLSAKAVGVRKVRMKKKAVR